MVPEPARGTLTPERILEATEEVLRRYGPAKATVVDVARALKVSHGSVYRHFRTKAALREAVTERWLNQSHDELRRIAEESAPAGDRVVRWLTALFEGKLRKATGDPELFATYLVLAGELSEAVDRHLDTLNGQLAAIIEDGRRRGEFVVPPPGTPEADPRTTALTVAQATAVFHDPVHAGQWTRPEAGEERRRLTELVLRGLRA
jgi:AcrR family transcriptional regulator